MQYQFGDIVLISFPFTEDGTVKNRPALVLFDLGDEDVIVARVTSQSYRNKFDLSIDKWKESGLLLPSIKKKLLLNQQFFIFLNLQSLLAPQVRVNKIVL